VTKTSQPSHLSHLSQLDHLRPPPGWRTDYAVLSTYSAQTSVIAAVLLALGGQDDESGSGTRVGLTRALRGLRGKVHFLVQSGRLTKPKKPAVVVSLFDRFIVQVPWDEGSEGLHAGKSWHAKFALVRHVPELASEQGERWVFMLGSRNLTMDLSWDIGLVLKSGDDVTQGQKTAPQLIEGIGQIASDLAELFPTELKRWASFSQQLGRALWHVPAGLIVSEIRLLLPDTPGRAIPRPVEQVHRVLAVSPFLDGGAVGVVADWGDASTTRQLLSTRMALEKLVKQNGMNLDKFNKFKFLLALPSPQHEIILGADGTREASSDDERVVADQIGLHAKMLFVEYGKGGTLWLGSPNLTQRAWTRNSECYAQVNVQSFGGESGLQLLEGIEAFVSMAEPVTLDALKAGDAKTSTEQILSDARTQVAARMVGATQAVGLNNGLIIKSAAPPHPDDLDIELACGPLMGPSMAWPRNSDSLEIGGAANALAASDFLLVRLSLDGVTVEWLQLVPWIPTLEEARDEAVLSEYLGPRQMMSWIHDVLNGFSNGDEGGGWDAPTVKRKHPKCGAPVILGLPSIDQALRMWLKDKTRLVEVDRILQIWTNRRKVPLPADSEADQAVEKHLHRFSRSWMALRKGLPKDVS